MFRKHAIVALTLVLSAAGLAAANPIVYTFQPNPSDLNDLPHDKVYLWGVDVTLGPGETVNGATLTFHNIRNWDNSSNILYNHLLDWAQRGVHTRSDNEYAESDYFAHEYAGAQTNLVTYQDLPSTAQTLVYTFAPAQVASLNSYLADGRIGIGIDPDCHFYNCGVELGLICTPEPASCLLLIGGALGLARRRR